MLSLRQTGRLPKRWALSVVTGSQMSVCIVGHRAQQAVTRTSSSYYRFLPICNHRAGYTRPARVLGYTPLNRPCGPDGSWPFRSSRCTLMKPHHLSGHRLLPPSHSDRTTTQGSSWPDVIWFPEGPEAWPLLSPSRVPVGFCSQQCSEGHE